MENNPKVCLITGATSGIGLATARALALQGWHVHLAGRNPAKCQGVVARLQDETGNPQVFALVADLSIQSQVRRLAADFLARSSRLDLLFNNAGGFFVCRQLTADGLEMTFALNHLSYFLLTNLLLDVLRRSAPARIVNVASHSHYNAGLDLADLQLTRRYSGARAYGRSKLANILFTNELARRLDGAGVTANALHPGFVATNIGKNNGPLAPAFVSIAGLLALSPQQGARTGLYLATSPAVAAVTGKYFFRENPVPPDPLASDPALARRLWDLSAALTGLEPPSS